MKQKLLWGVLAIFLFGSMVVASYFAGKNNQLPSSLQSVYRNYYDEGRKKELASQWIPCEKYKDFTTGITKDQQSKIMNSLKSTEDVLYLKKYACSKNIGWRAHIAKNKNTPSEILDFYSDDESWVVRNYLGANNSLSLKLQKKLSNDGAEQVLFSLSRNPNTAEEVLQKILDANPKDSIQESLAYNRGTSEDFKMQLAEKLTAPNALKLLKTHKNLNSKVQEILKKRSSTVEQKIK